MKPPDSNYGQLTRIPGPSHASLTGSLGTSHRHPRAISRTCHGHREDSSRASRRPVPARSLAVQRQLANKSRPPHGHPRPSHGHLTGISLASHGHAYYECKFANKKQISRTRSEHFSHISCALRLHYPHISRRSAAQH